MGPDWFWFCFLLLILVLRAAPSSLSDLLYLPLHTNIYRPLTAFRLRFCLDSLTLFECCLSPVPSLFMVVNILKTGTVARPGFGGDCEALGEGPVVDSEEGLLLSSKASPATGGRRWKDGRAL